MIDQQQSEERHQILDRVAKGLPRKRLAVAALKLPIAINPAFNATAPIK